MIVSQTAEYALRAVVWLAGRTDAALTTKALSAQIRVPEGYLAKVMLPLVRARLVSSQRGRNGGFRFLGDPAKTTVFDVIDAVDPLQRILTCPLGHASHGKRLCPLHRRLDQAMGMVQEAFRETTVADLLAESTSSPPLCARKTRGYGRRATA